MDISYYKEKYEPIDGKWYIKEMLGEGSYGKVFRVERKDMSGTYHINTAVDESLRNTVTSLHANSLCYRPAMVVNGSEMNIDIIYEENEFSDVEFAKLVKNIYESNSAISSASYQVVYVTAKISVPGKEYSPTKQVFIFCKESTGVISLSYRESDASDELKVFMETDELFVELQKNR